MWEVVDSLTMATWAHLVESVVDNTPMVRWPSSGQLVRSKWPMSGQPACMTGQCQCSPPTVASLQPIRQILAPIPARGVQMAQNCSRFVYLFSFEETKFADSKVSVEGRLGAQYAAHINVKCVERERHGKNTAHMRI